MKKKTYSEDSIERFAGLEGIRKKPTPYIGPTNGDGLWTIFREPADNAVDQALAGRNNMVHLIYDKKPNNYWVRDFGEGIPVGKKEFTDERGRVEKLSTFYVVTGLTHGGANFTGDEISRGCFTGDTKIRLLDGTTTTFENLYARWCKDTSPIEILSYNLNTKKLQASKISMVMIAKYTREIAHVTLKGGSVVKCTYDHPFYVLENDTIKKVQAQDLKPDMPIVSAYYKNDGSGYLKSDEGSYESANYTVSGVELLINDVIPVYDITVDETHTFFVDPGVLVSNTHGLGIKTTNAMSSFFKVWTFRDNSWWAIEYGSGKIVKDVHKSSAPKMPHGIKATKGTVVCFQPELKLFNKNSEINIDDVRDWCNLTSYLVPGLKVVFTNNKGLTKTLVHKRGPIEFIEKLVVELKATITGKIFTFSSKEADIAVAFSDAEGVELVNAYTNGLKNKEGGEHVRALHDALVKSLLPYKGKLEYTPTDLKEGLLGLVNYKISAPQFNNQPKDKLIDERVYAVALPQFLSAWADFWLKNKTMAKEVVTRAAELRKKTSDFLKDKKLIKNVKSASRALSTKMADITNNKIPFCERELFVIEGNSAAGCFVHTTKLRLANGTIKTYGELVEDFAKGIDHIGLAYDRTNKKAIPFKYDWPRVTKYTTSLVEVELEDGSKEQCTPEHKWLTSNRGYVQAKDLTPDDDIVVAKVP